MIKDEYFYPESSLEASVFLGCEFEQQWADGEWHKSQVLSVGDFPELSYNNEEPIRIHRSVAAPNLEYREGEAFIVCHWNNDLQEYELILGEQWIWEIDSFPVLHWTASIFCAGSADAFRELWAWLEGGKS